MEILLIMDEDCQHNKYITIKSKKLYKKLNLKFELEISYKFMILFLKQFLILST